jgi:hypothetical protein
MKRVTLIYAVALSLSVAAIGVSEQRKHLLIDKRPQVAEIVAATLTVTGTMGTPSF